MWSERPHGFWMTSQFDTGHTGPILDTQLDDLGLGLATASDALEWTDSLTFKEFWCPWGPKMVWWSYGMSNHRRIQSSYATWKGIVVQCTRWHGLQLALVLGHCCLVEVQMDESRPQITLQDLSLNCLLENTRLLLGAPHFFDLDIWWHLWIVQYTSAFGIWACAFLNCSQALLWGPCQDPKRWQVVATPASVGEGNQRNCFFTALWSQVHEENLSKHGEVRVPDWASPVRLDIGQEQVVFVFETSSAFSGSKTVDCGWTEFMDMMWSWKLRQFHGHRWT